MAAGYFELAAGYLKILLGYRMFLSTNVNVQKVFFGFNSELCTFHYFISLLSSNVSVTDSVDHFTQLEFYMIVSRYYGMLLPA